MELHPPIEVYEASLSALVEFPAMKMARRPGAAPGELRFGDSVAQAGARRKLERSPGVAPGPSTWRAEVLLLNYNREK